MSGMATASVDVCAAIVRELAGKEVRPFDLLAALGNKGYNDSDIKQGLSELLHDGKIELTSKRMLRPAAKHDAA